MTKLTARKLALGLSLMATAVAGTAYAEQTGRGGRDAGAPQTRAQALSQAEARFDRMDANKDGKLDKADHEARRNAAFDRLDTDKNGQISRAEFNTRPERAPRSEARRSPDGEQGKQHRWGGRGHGRHGGMWGGPGGGFADANKDGTVTKAEFTASALQRFDRLDANKDGQVTREERQAARQAMREEWKKNRGAQVKPAAPAKPAS